MAVKCPQCQLNVNFDEEGNIICHFCGYRESDYQESDILDNREDIEDYLEGE